MQRLAGRDLFVLSSAALLWWLADAWEKQALGFLPVGCGALAGVLLGLVWGYAAHEWGHLFGALLGRSRIRVSAHLVEPKLFDFDTSENSRKQFLLMAWGGLLLLWVQAGVFVAVLPWDSVAGMVAIGFAVLGALVTTSIEAPIATRVALGGSLPNPRAR